MTLHNIGKKIKGLQTDAQRGVEPYKLKGSHKLPTFVVDKPPRKPKITIAPPFVDKRYLPDADYEGVFSSTHAGINPLTNKPW